MMKNAHFLDVAGYYESVMDSCDLSQDAFAKRIGVSQSTVANYLRMLTLPESVRSILKESDLKVRHARELLRLKTEEDQIDAVLTACKENMSIGDLKDLVDRSIMYPEKRGKRRAMNILVKTINWATRFLAEKQIAVKVGKRESPEHIDIIIRVRK